LIALHGTSDRTTERVSNAKDLRRVALHKRYRERAATQAANPLELEKCPTVPDRLDQADTR
jgi:hypothetical protein